MFAASEKERIATFVIENLIKCYDKEQKKLAEIGHHHKTEGEIRNAAGNLVEHILQNIFDSINVFLTEKIISKIGSADYLSKSVKYKGTVYSFNTIQVDRHIWFKNQRLAFIENKTYLDSCYYDRALADFRKIAQSLKQHGIDPSLTPYIVFAGQKAAKDRTLFAYTIDFFEDTKLLTINPEGLSTYIFYFLEGTRNSSKPLYKIKHPLNISEIKRFVFFMLDLIK